MHWVRTDSSDFGGNLPIARSGHTAVVNVGKSKLVVFGGFVDGRFLVDISVYDVGLPVNLLVIRSVADSRYILPDLINFAYLKFTIKHRLLPSYM